MTSSTGYGSALIVFLVCLLPLIVSSVGFDQSCISGHHHKAVPGAEDLSTTKVGMKDRYLRARSR
jgi:hypothetical protein